jgi:hypothetical protein
MTIRRATQLALLLILSCHRALAGGSGHWIPSPWYNAHYCPSAYSVEPGGTIEFRAKADNCNGVTNAYDYDTYVDVYGNEIPPPPGESNFDATFVLTWTITGPNAYNESHSGTLWDWTAPCVPGTYQVSWHMENTRPVGPRWDPPTGATLGNVTVTALPEVSIVVPACDDEYVSGTSRIKVFASSPDGISSVSLYVDDDLKGQMTQQADYWVYYWNTAGTSQGAHTVQAVATNTHGCAGTIARRVYAHPQLTLTGVYFEQDHTLWDRFANDATGGAVIERPQWTSSQDSPVAYTRSSEMKVRPRIVSASVTGAVQLRYMAGMYWSDSSSYTAEKTASGVTLPYSGLAYHPSARGTMGLYACDETYQFFVRKCPESDWCPAGEAEASHAKVYHTLADPSSPWGQSEPVWAAVLDEACYWGNGQTTAIGALTAITIGLHSRTTGQYKYNDGVRGFSDWHSEFPSEIMYLNCFLNVAQKQGDCRDFGSYLSLLANSVGVNLKYRITRNPPSGRLLTNEYYRAGNPLGSAIARFSFHQYGLYNGVYDAAIRFTSGGDPPANMVEENGTQGDYESALVDEYIENGGGVWYTEQPGTPAIAKDWLPTIIDDYTWHTELTTSSVVVHWRTNVAASSRIHWDINSHPTGNAASYAYHSELYDDFPLKDLHNMSIGGLVSNTRYYCRVESSGRLCTEKQFTTLADP